MAGFDTIKDDDNEAVMFANNASFDGTERGGILDTNGQVWMGAATGQHVRKGEIVGGTGITVAYEEPSSGTNLLRITNTGETQPTTVTGLGETEVTESPTGNWNIFSPRVSAYIVDPTADYGTHTTIGSAMTAAQSTPGEILIRPGTYPEDLTGFDGMRLTAFPGDQKNPTVQITGKISQSSGASTISGIRLVTDGDYALEATGSASIECQFCSISANDNTAIHVNTSGLVTLRYCTGGTQDTEALFAVTSGQLAIRKSSFSVAGTPATSTVAGNLTVEGSNLGGVPITTSSSGSGSITRSTIDTNGLNTTCLTTVGTGTFILENVALLSGSAAAISIGTGTTVELVSSSVYSTNSNPISGAGTLIYAGVDFRNTGNGISATTQTERYTQQGKFRAGGQPAFLALPNGDKSNVTGNGTVYTIVYNSEIFDQDSNFNGTTTFTAPVTGKYLFNASVNLAGVTASGTFANLTLVTSNRSFRLDKMGTIGANIDGGQIIFNGSVLADMDASDTATVTIQTGGEGADVVDVVGTGTHGSFFSCELIA